MLHNQNATLCNEQYFLGKKFINKSSDQRSLKKKKI